MPCLLCYHKDCYIHIAGFTLRYTPDMKDIFIVEADGSLTPIRLLNKHDNASVKRDKVRLAGGED